MFGYTPGSCMVLLYHRVADFTTDPQLLCVTPENFEIHLKLLKDNYNVLTAEEFSEHLSKKKPFPRKSVFITFDDGYADNCINALPILEKYSLQALFYIATGLIGTNKEYWWDEMERIFLLNENAPSGYSYEINEKEYPIYNADSGQKLKLYEQLLGVLRNMDSTTRDEHISQLSILFNAPDPRKSHRAMNPEELKIMSASGSAVIGAHTHRHPSLGALSYEEQHKEISTSKEFLEKATGKIIRHFSYPFGTSNDYNSDTIEICRELGFDLVAANYPSVVTIHCNKFAFPRFLVRNWDEKTFLSQLKSFSRS